MLAFSVREALRQAAAAFGPAGISVDLASPATPEAVYWALHAARSQQTEHGHVGEGAPGMPPPQPGNGAPPMRPFSERFQDTRSHA
jgi:xanthine dehydrogenase large subunit